MAKKPLAINLSKEKRAELKSSLKDYFYESREEELGDLAAELMLNFIIDELGPEFYNQGVFDAYKYINDRTEDILGLQK